MEGNYYEVLYVDKFSDLVEAAVVNDTLRKTFGLNHRHLLKLSAGTPVVIKKKVGIEEAERYKGIVMDAGGVAWIQELGPEGEHLERRQEKRRSILDRRTVYRASSIVPDRRQDMGRRSTDRKNVH